MKSALKILDWLGKDEATLHRMPTPVGLRQRLALAERLSRSVPADAAPPLLIWEDEQHQPRYRKIAQVLTIGRLPSSDISLLSSKVSRHHCEVGHKHETYVSDLGSLNGTKVNGHRLGHGRHALKSGDLIEIGPATFLYLGPDSPSIHTSPQK